jgi:LacI family transcriptional regulator
VEIAKLAGVSRSTVSRVINNYPNVPKKTHDKVMKVIEEYNYFPNISGRTLAGKSVHVLGLFIVGSFNISVDILTNQFISSVIESASSRNYHVLTSIIRNAKDPTSIKNVKEVFFQKRIDAGIFVGAANHEPLIEELIAEGFTIGIFDQELKGRSEPNRIVVNYDTTEGTEKIFHYLYGLNHRKIGILNGDLKRFTGLTKYQEFVNMMEKYDLSVNPSWVLPGDFNEQSGYQAMQTLLKKEKGLPTAIIAASDSIAFGALRAMNEYALKIPDDISIISYDDHLMSAFVKPALTTMHVDYTEMMRQLTLKIISIVEEGNDQFIKMMFGSELVIRDSCKKI